MKFLNIRHDIALSKLRKAEETEEDAAIEIKDAKIEIDLNTITQKEY